MVQAVRLQQICKEIVGISPGVPYFGLDVVVGHTGQRAPVGSVMDPPSPKPPPLSTFINHSTRPRIFADTKP